MPIRNLFASLHDRDVVLQAMVTERGTVEIYIEDLSGCQPINGFVNLDPEDIPALCVELQRVAKLAKEGGSNG
tara:strand:+ start:50 stop:268 length:219 start_codon:yes stop_codon:yes gene_type:complete